MPNFARLELKPSPSEFKVDVFLRYYNDLKEDKKRFSLFCLILSKRDFSEIEEMSEGKGLLELNQCLIEALDIALNTLEEDLDDEFAFFGQTFKVNPDKYKSPLKLINKIIFPR